MPLPKSTLLTHLSWLGPRIPYAASPYKADTFPITWADDDLQYASGGDPVSESKKDGLNIISLAGNPTDYQINLINEMPDFRGWGGHGLKPTGMLCLHNTLYLFAQNLGQWTHENAEKCHGYDSQIFQSTDKGKTWTPDIKAVEKSPMFPGRDFGSPCFINYGKNHNHATDHFIYALSGQGWTNGNSLKLGRVPDHQIMDRAAWQFVAHLDAHHHPTWTHDLKSAIPIVTDPGFLGYPECIYLPTLKRYLLAGNHFKNELPEKFDSEGGSELAIYEAPQPWGPFSLITKIDWETPEVTPYNPRLPLKWFNEKTLEGHLLFSGSWRNGGSTEFYRPQTRPFKLHLALPPK